MDYSTDELSRQVLEKALTATDRPAGRLYATQFMLVLLRAKIPHFEVWGLPLLIRQTKDKETMVVLAAIEILDEACHDRVSLIIHIFFFALKVKFSKCYFLSVCRHI